MGIFSSQNLQMYFTVATSISELLGFAANVQYLMAKCQRVNDRDGFRLADCDK